MKKIIIVAGVVVLLIAGWGTLFSRVSDNDTKKEIQYYKQLAEEQMELEAYGSVIKCYENIISLEAVADNYLQLAEVYRMAEKYTSYKGILEEIVDKFPNDVRAYEKLSAYYRDVNAYQECVDIVRQASRAEILNEKLLEDYYSTAYQYGFSTIGLGEAGYFYNGYALVKINNKYIYIDSGMKTTSIEYEYAAPYISTITGVTLDGNTYYVDEKGEKYLDSKEKYERAYAYSEGMSLVQFEGKFYYVTSSNQRVWEGYDDATLFKNGVAAIKKADSWTVINTACEPVNESVYTDILIDEDDVCSNMGVIFVSEGNGYYMIDTEGKKISDIVYEDAKPFFESNITAVKLDGKWGFVTIEGSMIIEPQYEDARTFGKGIGAVMVNGEWGFVNSENRMVIEPAFEDAKCFSSNGLAPIKKDGTWGYIRLYVNE